MSGEYWTINSKDTLKNAIAYLSESFEKHKFVLMKACAGKRTLDQNALLYRWYKDIADSRKDVTPDEVRRECKLNYGIPILRRDPVKSWVYEKTLDRLPYEKKLKIMHAFEVTQIMSIAEKKEFLSTMQNEYPFLTNERT